MSGIEPRTCNPGICWLILNTETVPPWTKSDCPVLHTSSIYKYLCCSEWLYCFQAILVDHPGRQPLGPEWEWLTRLSRTGVESIGAENKDGFWNLSLRTNPYFPYDPSIMTATECFPLSIFFTHNSTQFIHTKGGERAGRESIYICVYYYRNEVAFSW